MARLVKDTPILEGEDAKTFRKNLRDMFSKPLTSKEKKDIREEEKRMKESYNLMVSISGGTFC
jgi:hypothetical protein